MKGAVAPFIRGAVSGVTIHMVIEFNRARKQVGKARIVAKHKVATKGRVFVFGVCWPHERRRFIHERNRIHDNGGRVLGWRVVFGDILPDDGYLFLLGVQIVTRYGTAENFRYDAFFHGLIG